MIWDNIHSHPPFIHTHDYLTNVKNDNKMWNGKNEDDLKLSDDYQDLKMYKNGFLAHPYTKIKSCFPIPFININNIQLNE